jgi:CheY-like chemotaxis protein
MKFLLIEYEPRYLDRIRGILLTQPDVELVAARDGEEGLEAYRRSRPDLVLVSSVLPKMRTPDVIKGMQALGPTPPILLMMSGYKGRNKRADAQRVGATSILEKPFTEEIFQAEVAMALGHRPILDSGSHPRVGDPRAPLLSSEDIFSDVLTGLGEGGSNDAVRPPLAPIVTTPATTGVPAPRASSVTHPAFPAPPAKPVSTPAADPSVQKRLEQTLSGLMPSPKKHPTAPFPAANEPLRPSSGEKAARVNVEQALGALAQSAASGGSAVRPVDPASRASVDKLLHDTLSGLMPISKSPRPVSREISGETLRLKTPVAEPPAPRPPSSPAVLPPVQVPVPPARPLSSVAAHRVTPAPGQFGRYLLLEKIGSGGMAEVFKARMRGEEGFEKIVAIKRIVPHMAANDAFITMFVDEAKLAAQLNHNNITHIYDLGKVDAWHYIAMEFVEGKDLRTLLKLAKERAYPLPAELALFIAAKIANALDYAHRRPAADGTELNLVHRDVSPQNILISYEGDIKLCDFGIAKAASKVSTTISGALKGKLQYMSPEQAWGKRVDRRSDVFSLGAVLYEMLTGSPLFEGDTDMSVLERVREGEVEPPSARGVEVSKRVDQIVLKALAKNPQDRYQNASEMEKDLHAVLYAFQPSPGPADIAIYLHRLLEASAAPPTGDEIDAAFDAARDMAPPAAAPVLPKKGKGLLIQQTGELHLPPAAPVPREGAPAPRREAPRAAVEAAASIPAAGESKSGRTGLFAGIGLAVVALVGVAIFMTKDRWSGPKAPPPAAMPKTESAAPAPETGSAAAPAPTAEVARVVDPRAVEAEARRLAAEREKAAKDAAGKQAAAARTGSAPAPAVLTLQPAKTAAEAPKELAVKAPEPLSVAAPPAVAPPVASPVAAPPVVVAPAKQEPAVAPPVPTEVSAPERAPAIPAPSNAPVKEGELVGPGEGVEEPKLVRLGPMAGMPMQARQVKRAPDGSIGTPVLMALVDERGVVVETRLIRPSSYKFADDAAARALKGATIRPATKDGVKVKMWKTFPIAVRP